MEYVHHVGLNGKSGRKDNATSRAMSERWETSDETLEKANVICHTAECFLQFQFQ